MLPKQGANVQSSKSVPSSTVDSIIRHIDRMIGEGILQPGDQLSEPKLCAVMGVGRVPVREAIRILAGEGVLDLVPHRSARVRCASKKEILEMMETLSGFSVLAIHLICTAPAQHELIGKLEMISDKIARIAKDELSATNDIWNQISCYHFVLIEGSNNKYLMNLLLKLHIRYYIRNVVKMLGRRSITQAAPFYKKITKAVACCDQHKAIRILFKQVQHAKQRIDN